jgi:hypothetical protein
MRPAQQEVDWLAAEAAKPAEELHGAETLAINEERGLKRGGASGDIDRGRSYQAAVKQLANAKATDSSSPSIWGARHAKHSSAATEHQSPADRNRLGLSRGKRAVQVKHRL